MTHRLRLSALVLLLVVGYASYVVSDLRPLPDDLEIRSTATSSQRILDRHGNVLYASFSDHWNESDRIPLHQVPILLREAFIAAEDKRFYEHSGVDWRARLHAVAQNIRALRVVRGASTISEQVVRMLHPRPRSLKARILEGLEAQTLESRLSKSAIFELYLNQVPYAARRRGVSQAARMYFDRDLETLSPREMIALAILVRAPSRLDLFKNPSSMKRRVTILASTLHDKGVITDTVFNSINSEDIRLTRGDLPAVAPHFVHYVRNRDGAAHEHGTVQTSLDSTLQQKVRTILESRIRDLSTQRVTNGAVLAVDARTAEVLAWANAGEFSTERGSQIDAIVTPRQPGSTLKPFLYALALSKGWTAATLIDDAPTSEPVGSGLHTYRNYSRSHYGLIPLRDALGNSLNIPAIKTIQFTGKPDFLDFLRRAGFSSLTEPAEHYGEGLALGNGEVTLFELTQGYTALASRGVWRPLRVTATDEVTDVKARPRTLVTPETASIISNILSDPNARRLEFGSHSVLSLPLQTAVKTGTSSDYRDAWAVGYSNSFVVGVWLGNLSRDSMYEISGARGPALVLRSVFAELEATAEPRDLFVSTALERHAICPLTGLLAQQQCPRVEELFIAHTAPARVCAGHHAAISPEEQGQDAANRVEIALPTPGLHLALDPRIPDDREAFAFELSSRVPLAEVEWIVDDQVTKRYQGDVRRHIWSLQRGRHTVRATGRIRGDGGLFSTEQVDFFVR